MLVSRSRAIHDTGIVDVTMDVEWCCPLTSQRSSPIPSFSQHSGHRPPRSEEGPCWHFVRWQRKHPAVCLPEESSPPFPDCPSCEINNRLYFTVTKNGVIDHELRPNLQATQYLKAVLCCVSFNFPGTLTNGHTSSLRAAPCLFFSPLSAGAMRWWWALDTAIPSPATGGALHTEIIFPMFVIISQDFLWKVSFSMWL